MQPALGQDNAAAERAKLGNQRVAAEMERRNRELAREAAAVPTPGEQTVETPAESRPESAGNPADTMDVTSTIMNPQPVNSQPAPESVAQPQHSGATAPAEFVPARRPEPIPRAAPNANIDDTLQQLKALGELRDAGYLDEAEFERIKRRIIEDNF